MKKILYIIVSVGSILIELVIATILMLVFIEFASMSNITFIEMVILFGIIIMCIGSIICTIIDHNND